MDWPLADTEAQPAPSYAQDPRRWFVLSFFTVWSFNQCYTWFTFASTDVTTMEGYFGPGMDKATVDWLLNWGPIGGILAFPLQTWVTAKPGGLRVGLWLGMLLTLFGNVARTLPILAAEFTSDRTIARTDAAFVLYHAGQFLNALAGPFCMAACTSLSCVWFAESERTTATAVAQTANGIGCTFGFLNPIVLAPSAPSVPNIFYLGVFFAAAPCLCGIIYLPARPPHFPSAAAVAVVASESVGGTAGADARATAIAPSLGSHASCETGDRGAPSSGCSAARLSFAVLLLTVGMMTGILIGWQACLQSILNPMGISQKSVGYIGLANGLAGNVGSVASGRVSDRWFQRRLKAGIVFGVTGSLVCIAWFTASLPCVLYDRPPLGHTEGSLVAAVTLLGLFQGVCTPLFYELSAELLYPQRESTSAGAMVLLLNMVAMAMIRLNSSLRPSYMNLVTVVVVAVALVMVLFVREEYRRPRDTVVGSGGGEGEAASAADSGQKPASGGGGGTAASTR